MIFKKQSYSRSFILRYTLLTSVFVSLLFFICSFSLQFTFSSVKKALDEKSIAHARTVADLLKLQIERFNNIHTIKVDSSNILECRIFERAEDERDIVLRRTLIGNSTLLSDQALTDEGSNVILDAYYAMQLNDSRRTNGSQFWYNAYFPAEIGEKRYIIQAAISADSDIVATTRQSEIISTFIRVMILTSIVSFILLFFLSLHFFHGISYFFKLLAQHAADIVSGKHQRQVSNEDEDFSLLAQSFNTLVEELKDKDKRISELQLQSNLDTLFKTGVSFLKKKQYDAAEHIFSTLTYIKPGSYGSFFNLGVIYAKQSRYEESLDMFETALDLNPDDTLTLSYCEKIRRHLEISGAHEKIS